MFVSDTALFSVCTATEVPVVIREMFTVMPRAAGRGCGRRRRTAGRTRRGRVQVGQVLRDDQPGERRRTGGTGELLTAPRHALGHVAHDALTRLEVVEALDRAAHDVGEERLALPGSDSGP